MILLEELVCFEHTWHTGRNELETKITASLIGFCFRVNTFTTFARGVLVLVLKLNSWFFNMDGQKQRPENEDADSIYTWLGLTLRPSLICHIPNTLHDLPQFPLPTDLSALHWVLVYSCVQSESRRNQSVVG